MKNRIKAIGTPTKILAGVAAGLLAGGAVVYAHNGDQSAVHACWNPDTQGVRIVGAPTDAGFRGNPSTTCGGPEFSLDWNVAGPQGPPGPEGPAGPAGPKGDAGSAGANGSDGTSGGSTKTGTLHTVRKRVGPSSAVIKSAVASCAKGQRIVTGGYELPGNIPAVTAKASRPNGTSGWYARAFRARGNGAWQLVVYAICST